MLAEWSSLAAGLLAGGGTLVLALRRAGATASRIRSRLERLKSLDEAAELAAELARLEQDLGSVVGILRRVLRDRA